MSNEKQAVDVTIRSWLNFDGFECNGHGYKLDELDELSKEIGDSPINWVRGRNTFAGKPVSDRFMVDMKKTLLDALGREDDGIDVTKIEAIEPQHSSQPHKLPVKPKKCNKARYGVDDAFSVPQSNQTSCDLSK